MIYAAAMAQALGSYASARVKAAQYGPLLQQVQQQAPRSQRSDDDAELDALYERWRNEGLYPHSAYPPTERTKCCLCGCWVAVHGRIGCLAGDCPCTVRGVHTQYRWLAWIGGGE